jgi:hypothetical protein
MRKIVESGEKLTWIRESEDSRNFILKGGQETVGSIRWDKEAGSLAVGEAKGQRWTFKRVGFFHSHITVRNYGVAEEFARVEVRGGGAGMIHFSDGERYNFLANLWRAEWQWATPSGSTMIKFRRDFSIDERAGDVLIPQEHLSTIHLPLLIVLGWYLIVLIADDAAMSWTISGA